jgi:hypothetical protein
MSGKEKTISHPGKQIRETSTRSKNRVRDIGEVFTAEREVNAMLDLVKHETERIESRFLEPACGNGNFLAPVLERKLLAVERAYKKSQLEYERNVLIAIGSIYGVDLMKNNVEECCERLYKMFETAYMTLYKKKAKTSICISAKAILRRNILWGNGLSLKTPDPENPKPIVFSEWSRPFNDSRIKRHDYDFEEIVTKDEPSLLKAHKMSDLGDKVFQVHPVQSFPLTHMTKLGNLA